MVTWTPTGLHTSLTPCTESRGFPPSLVYLPLLPKTLEGAAAPVMHLVFPVTDIVGIGYNTRLPHPVVTIMSLNSSGQREEETFFVALPFPGLFATLHAAGLVIGPPYQEPTEHTLTP